jgi:hypothetical protein
MAQVLAKREYGFALRSALELFRSVNGKAWEDTATIFRQIPTIGPKSMKKLEQVGCTSKCNPAMGVVVNSNSFRRSDQGGSKPDQQLAEQGKSVRFSSPCRCS